jgi:hypothetical protein
MTSLATPRLVRRGQRLAWLTIGWNSVEGIVAIASGAVAGSIALVGFGVDSFVEVFAGSVIVWRLAQERHGAHISEAAERSAVKLIAGTFFLLSIGIAIESARKLIGGEHPETSVVGIVVTTVSLIVMPRDGQPGRPSRCHGNHTVRVALGHRARRTVAQRVVRVVVGRPRRRTRHRLCRRTRGNQALAKRRG